MANLLGGAFVAGCVDGVEVSATGRRRCRDIVCHDRPTPPSAFDSCACAMPSDPSSTPPPADRDDTLPVAPGRVLPAAALRFAFSRASGPGGQNVNKVNTRATLTVDFADLETILPRHALDRLRQVASHYLAAGPDRLVIHAGDSRSQRANRKACLDRLRRVLLLALHRPPVRRATRPSRGAVQRRLTAKKQRGEIKKSRGRPRAE